ncbi:MAG: hypothetical protein V9E87_17485 [Gemmatimonadales bacterium]
MTHDSGLTPHDSNDPRAWYFDVRFRAESPISHWPTEFIIVTGYATTGEVWPEEKNLEADLRLRRELQEMGRWHVRLTGYSPVTGHAEPGWAVLLNAAEGRGARPPLRAGRHLCGAARRARGPLLRRWARGEGRVVAGAGGRVRSSLRALRCPFVGATHASPVQKSTHRPLRRGLRSGEGPVG